MLVSVKGCCSVTFSWTTLCREWGHKGPTVRPSVPQWELPVVPGSLSSARGFTLKYALGCPRREHRYSVLMCVFPQTEQDVCSLEETVMVLCFVPKNIHSFKFFTFFHLSLEKGNKKLCMLIWTNNHFKLLIAAVCRYNSMSTGRAHCLCQPAVSHIADFMDSMQTSMHCFEWKMA